MAVKAFMLVCVQALVLQTARSQCLPAGGCGFIPAASTGGTFVVTSASPVAPTGVSVVSENLYEGALCVEGNLPLLGSVALEGAMGSAGAGAVSYGCGDGCVEILVEEGPIVTGIAPEADFGFDGLGLGFDNGFGFGGFGLGDLSFGGLGFGGFGGYGYGNGFFGRGYGNSFGYGNGLGYGNGIGYGNGLGFGNGFGFGGYGGYGGLGGLGGFGGYGLGLGGIY